MGTIKVVDVSKAYKQYPSQWARLSEWLLPYSNVRHSQNWVLRNITFDVPPGETLGIVGMNGAGKSTLLKIIAGTVQPSSGSVQLSGKIAALLELGMGFDSEFTGRQNCFISGQLYGLRNKEIEKLISHIYDFAEIGDYFDKPVRTYSSGMKVRLAFALATAKRPAILIIDEALSVGDAYFKHKSFDRIRQFRDSGTTLLFVSHDINAIQSLCNRAILLEHGVIIKDGEPEEVTDLYNALIAKKENTTVEVIELENGKKQTTSGSGKAIVKEITLLNNKGQEVESVGVGEQVVIQIKVKVQDIINSLVLGYAIKDRFGQVMYGINTWHMKQVITDPTRDAEYIYNIEFQCDLGIGSYSIATALTEDDTHLSANYEWRDLALIFHVVNIDKKQFVGSSWIEPKIEVIKR